MKRKSSRGLDRVDDRVVDVARHEHERVGALEGQRAQHDPVRAARAVDREHRAIGPCAAAANASASAKIPVWSTSVPKKPAEIETSEA
jgi:hypothetical protein